MAKREKLRKTVKKKRKKATKSQPNGKKSRKGVGGRPSKYDPKYCQEIIDFLGQGFSIEAFAGYLGMAIDTIYQWDKKHPEFSEAKKIGVAMSQYNWERKGIDGLYKVTETNLETGISTTRQINSAIWIFNMINRFGWRQKADVTSDGKATGGIVITMPDNGYGPKPGEDA